MSEIPEIDYALYTHFNLHEREDFVEWKKGHYNFEATSFLKTYWGQLLNLLAKRARKGVLIIFYAPGWVETFQGIQDNRGMEVGDDPEPRFAQRMKREILKSITNERLKRRLRIVTASDLVEIFRNIGWDLAGRLRDWFMGSSMTYDSPKVIEAILRIRLLGSGIPVFRLDHDVLFTRTNAELPGLDLAPQIDAAINGYRDRRSGSQVSSFMFSVAYRNDGVRNGSDEIGDWERAFATRVYPALKVTTFELPQKQEEAARRRWRLHFDRKYTKYMEYKLQMAFNQTAARRFLGFIEARDVPMVLSQPLSGIARIGANPLEAVISGALLCLSDGAILDLPPFSNFGRNASWIDDHLKLSLHVGLGHFIPIPEFGNFNIPGGVLVRIPGAAVVKDRPAQDEEKFVNYVFGVYLPALYRGAVVDYWIQEEPSFKSTATAEGMRRLNNRGKPGILVSGLQNVLRKGRLARAAREELYADLKNKAIERINHIYDEWSDLKADGEDTFASRWATGQGPEGKKQGGSDRGSMLEGLVRRDWVGGSNSGIHEEDLNVSIRDDLNILINAAISYIEWALTWPNIIQAIRAVDQGALPSDLLWIENAAKRGN